MAGHRGRGGGGEGQQPSLRVTLPHFKGSPCIVERSRVSTSTVYLGWGWLLRHMCSQLIKKEARVVQLPNRVTKNTPRPSMWDGAWLASRCHFCTPTSQRPRQPLSISARTAPLSLRITRRPGVANAPCGSMNREGSSNNGCVPRSILCIPWILPISLCSFNN